MICKSISFFSRSISLKSHRSSILNRCMSLISLSISLKKRGVGVIFAGGREMKIFSTVFRDFSKNMVGKRSESLTLVGNY